MTYYIEEYMLLKIYVWSIVLHILSSCITKIPDCLYISGCSIDLTLKLECSCHHDDVIKRKHLPRHWPFARGIRRSPVNFPHKGKWSGNLIFSLIGTWTNGWVINRNTDALRRHLVHYDVMIMMIAKSSEPIVLYVCYEQTLSYMRNRFNYPCQEV